MYTRDGVAIPVKELVAIIKELVVLIEMLVGPH
jgi:hypothetical protein